MLGCPACQEQMLDHLYGLLDEVERQEFLSHLDACADCQAAMDKARAQQRLLAAAARLPIPPGQFVRPAEPETNDNRSIHKVGSWVVRWTYLATAAALLLAIGVGGWFGIRARNECLAANRVVQNASAMLVDAESLHAEASKETVEILTERDKAIRAIAEETRARELRLVVTGPRYVQPGAAAEYYVRAFDLNERPVDAQFTAHLEGVRLRHENDVEKKPAVADSKSGVGRNETAKDAAKSNVVPLRIESLEKGRYKLTVPPNVEFDVSRAPTMAISARRPDKQDTREQLTLRGNVSLTAPVLLTHLTTDKPMYQPGEVVRYRSLTLDRSTMIPAADELHLRYTLTPPLGPQRVVAQGSTLLNDGKSTINGPDGKPIRGIGAGEFSLEADAPGGEYTLSVSEDSGRFTPVVRRFIVNHYQKPRLDKKLDFNRSSYGPGEEVQALATARRADGGPLSHCPIEATLSVDGTILPPVKTTTDEDGQVIVKFRLPQKMQRGLGSLSVLFQDAGTPEPISRPVPIVLNDVAIEFFPEGGNLLAGLPARVYFQARTPAGKPAQVSGTLLEDGKPTDVKLTTLSDDVEAGVNQGLGLFAFTPRMGKSYAIRVDEPKGITAFKPLPNVEVDGASVSVEGGVFRADQEIRVKVRSTKPRLFLVGAYCRGTLLDSVTLSEGQTEAVLRPQSTVGGVCRVTVFEMVNVGTEQRTLVPRAERLLYRHPATRLDVSLGVGRKVYAPAEKASVKLITTNEAERPVPAIAQLAIVDQSVLTMADERNSRTMPTHFLLATEVRRAEELEHADFLIGQHPKAPVVLDLLLGTQGWRRFVEQRPSRFLEARQPGLEKPLDADEAARWLVMVGQSEPLNSDLDQAKAEAIAITYEDRIEPLRVKEEEAAKRVEEARSIPRSEEYLAAVATLRGYASAWQNMISLSPFVGLIFILGGIGIALRRTLAKLSIRSYVNAFGVMVVTVILLLGLSFLSVQKPTDHIAKQFAKAVMMAGGERLAMDEPKMERQNNRVLAVEEFGGLPVPAAAIPADERRLDDRVQAAAMPPGRPMAPMQRDQPPQRLLARQIVEADAINRFRGTVPARRNAALDRAEFKGEPLAGKEGEQAQLNGLRRKMRGLEYVPLVVREYAHVRPQELSAAVRADFSETVYWHPVLLLPDGHTEVSFQLSDSVTRFKVTAFAHTLDGRIGAASTLIESRLPVSVSPKLPTEVTSTDRLRVPVALASTSIEKQQVTLAIVERSGLDAEAPETAIDLPPEASRRVVLPIRPIIREGMATLTVGAGGDTARHTLRVVPDGFPTERSAGGTLEKSVTHPVTLPADMITGSLKFRVDAYPSPLADLTKGLDGLLREPYGCFEQTSSTNYPNVLALAFLRDQNKSNPVLEGRARVLLERGYKRLISFECENPAQNSKQGFEWFGGSAPPHEALTAYGLLQFTDMARVADVDAAMLGRTRSFLMGRKDGKGSFARNPKALDGFGRASEMLTNAYIVWALTETGTDDVDLEIKTLVEQAKKSNDAYLLSLVALSLLNRNQPDAAAELQRRIAKAQKADGSLTGETSITSSGGVGLAVETSGLAVLGWLKGQRSEFNGNIDRAIRWITSQRQGGGAFGSTQATIIALKALLAHSRTAPRNVKEGEMKLFVGDTEVGRTRVTPTAGPIISLEMMTPEALLKPGPNMLRIEMTPATNVMPYTLSWNYRAVKPESEADPLVKLTTTLAKTQMKEGETVRLMVRVENTSEDKQGMVTAIIGLPAGLALPENLEQLRGYSKSPTEGEALISAFEVSGRELVLYWRSMKKGQSIEVPLDLIAKVPGTYRGPASRAYPYYNARAKHWTDPISVQIDE